MISFVLNETLVNTDKQPGMTLLDFIRNEAGLKATKTGCREGDCGACTVLEGRIKNNRLNYQTIVSCLTPLGNVHGSHIVTTEGINQARLSPVQQALVDNNGTQCGFCTPGFVISLTSFLLSSGATSLEDAITAIDGNICRCTGYKSIERAAAELVELKKQAKEDPLQWCIENDFLPTYFKTIPEKLKSIENPENSGNTWPIIGGGTDLMVQKPDELFETKPVFFYRKQHLKGIDIKGGNCTIGAETVASDIMESVELRKYFPKLTDHFKLISSTPIRNMGTLAGNLVNASPIGDLSIFFLALNANVFLTDTSGNQRICLLRDFFLDYKKLNKQPDEFIEKMTFTLPEKETFFNFEKVSKRQFLDIASVNSAVSFKLENGKMEQVRMAAGGVSPIPLFLGKTSAFLSGNVLSEKLLSEANSVLQEEISPISDVRGSADYKRLLLRQLFFAHFIETVPELIRPSALLKPEHA